MVNSADPDQLASKKPTDLDLHCLQRQGIIPGSAGQGLIKEYQFLFYWYLKCMHKVLVNPFQTE